MADETSELKKMLEAAISRISTMEGELRNRPKEKEAPAFDLYRFRQALESDPIGTLTAMGVAPERMKHIETVLTVNSMGDSAPPHLKAYAMQGPQLMAAQAAADSVATLSRRLDDQDKQRAQATKREDFKAISANKEKYPNLAKAVAADSSLISEMDQHGGTAEEFAASQEAKLTKLATVFAPSTASVNADNQGQSEKTKPTPLAGGLNGDAPAVTKSKPGEWTPETYTKLRDEIVQKYSRPKV